MKDSAPTHNQRSGRIERLSKIDLDILAEMRQFLPRLQVEDPVEVTVESTLELINPPLSESSPLPVFVDEPSNAPPPHPASVDRGRYRIAEEPPGTDLHAPWVLDRCLECREKVYTHNRAVAEKHETICEDCYYRMVSDYWERQTQHRRQMMVQVINPFES